MLAPCRDAVDRLSAEISSSHLRNPQLEPGDLLSREGRVQAPGGAEDGVTLRHARPPAPRRPR